MENIFNHYLYSGFFRFTDFIRFCLYNLDMCCVSLLWGPESEKIFFYTFVYHWTRRIIFFEIRWKLFTFRYLSVKRITYINCSAQDWYSLSFSTPLSKDWTNNKLTESELHKDHIRIFSESCQFLVIFAYFFQTEIYNICLLIINNFTK